MKPVMGILTNLTQSMQKYPNIKPSQDLQGYNAFRTGTGQLSSNGYARSLSSIANRQT